MRRKIVNILLAACLTAGMAVGSVPAASLDVKAAADISGTVEAGLTIQESEINQLLTGNLTLPTTVSGLQGATIVYSVGCEVCFHRWEHIESDKAGGRTGRLQLYPFGNGNVI